MRTPSRARPTRPLAQALAGSARPGERGRACPGPNGSAGPPGHHARGDTRRCLAARSQRGVKMRTECDEMPTSHGDRAAMIPHAAEPRRAGGHERTNEITPMAGQSGVDMGISTGSRTGSATLSGHNPGRLRSLRAHLKAILRRIRAVRDARPPSTRPSHSSVEGLQRPVQRSLPIRRGRGTLALDVPTREPPSPFDTHVLLHEYEEPRLH